MKGEEVERFAVFLCCSTIVFCVAGCMDPRPAGEAGIEGVLLVPGDRIRLDTGDEGMVYADGMLRGIRNAEILAAGLPASEIIPKLELLCSFERYELMHLGKRQIEIRGAIKHPGVYDFPPDEEWSLMDFLLKVEGFSSSENQEYLLIRKAWQYPGAFIFLRGEAIFSAAGIGGDDLMLAAGDIVLFPGTEALVYIFGAVADQAKCFAFPDVTKPPTLQAAIEMAGGYQTMADIENVLVYRVLKSAQQSVYTVDGKWKPDFPLMGWDVIYVPPKIPRELVK